MTYPKYKNKHLEEALFGPEESIKYTKSTKFKNKKFPSLPKKYILTYQKSSLAYFKRKYKTNKIKVTNMITIYQYKDIGFVKVQGIGSPNVTLIFEQLIAHSGKYFLNIGYAGGLQHEGFFLCEKALRDEGTSYHYLPHGHYTFPDKELTEKLAKTLDKANISYQKAITWTIDASYRETKAEINRYKKMGISTVEMEASALFAVAQIRKVKIASAFVVSDVLGEKWEPKFHSLNKRRALNKLLDVAVECLQGER